VLLKRLSTDVKNQNWLSVFLDLLVVAVGIFIGLQASNWNDNRLERVEERQYLIRLYDDILTSISLLEQDIGFLEEQLSNQAIILKALDTCEFLPDDNVSMQRGIGSLGWLTTPRMVMEVSERINIVQNAKIKTEFSKLVSEVEFRNRILSSTLLVLARYRQLIDEQVSYDISKPLGGSKWAVAVNFDIQILCEQRRNKSAVSTISFNTREVLNSNRALLNLYKRFLPLLDKELLLRWKYAYIR
jgi:hypothetical protein